MNEDMSKQNPENQTDLMSQMHMQTLMKSKRNMETSQIIDDALEEYYSERGLSVPNWKTNKNPQWWIDYLEELGIDKNNP